MNPASFAGSDVTKCRAFALAFAQLSRRISIFISLPLAKLDDMSLKHKLNDIGRMQDQGE